MNGMNEQFDTLWEQARKEIGENADWKISDVRQRFAELIIANCCNVILSIDYNYATSPNRAMEDAVVDIKNQFGVEE